MDYKVLDYIRKILSRLPEIEWVDYRLDAWTKEKQVNAIIAGINFLEANDWDWINAALESDFCMGDALHSFFYRCSGECGNFYTVLDQLGLSIEQAAGYGLCPREGVPLILFGAFWREAAHAVRSYSGKV